MGPRVAWRVSGVLVVVNKEGVVIEEVVLPLKRRRSEVPAPASLPRGKEASKEGGRSRALSVWAGIGGRAGSSSSGRDSRGGCRSGGCGRDTLSLHNTVREGLRENGPKGQGGQVRKPGE